ncbi:MAG: hypothetical protein ACRD0Z_03545 [Acidimicrobiales bacterium]
MPDIDSLLAGIDPARSSTAAQPSATTSEAIFETVRERYTAGDELAVDPASGPPTGTRSRRRAGLPGIVGIAGRAPVNRVLIRVAVAACLLLAAAAGSWLALNAGASHSIQPATHHGGNARLAGTSDWKVVYESALASDVQLEACPGPSDCYGVAWQDPGHSASVEVSHDEGATWESVLRIPDLSQSSEELSCLAASECVLVTGAHPLRPGTSDFAAVTDSGGRLWHDVSVPGAIEVSAVSCLPLSLSGLGPTGQHRCIAIGKDTDHRVVTYLSTNGASWTAEEQTAMSAGPPESGLAAPITCASLSFCVITGATQLSAGHEGAELYEASNDGTTFTPVSPKIAMSSFSQIACPTADDCLVLGVDAFSSEPVEWGTTNGGVSWHESTGSWPDDGEWGDGSRTDPTVPDLDLSNLACSDPQHCVALMQSNGVGAAYAFSTTNGGASWQAGTQLGTNALVCEADGWCAGGQGFVSSNAGASFRPLVGPVGGLNDVACTGSAFCLALGGNVELSPLISLTTADGGKSWALGGSGTGGVGPALSCGAPGSCDAGLFYTADGGVVWQQALLPSWLVVRAVSCTTSSCLLVGDDTRGKASAYSIWRSRSGGRSWQQVSFGAIAGEATSVSCAGSSCVAVGWDATGDSSAAHVATRPIVLVSTDSGERWTPVGVPTGMAQPEAVQCVTASDCALVGVGPSASARLLAAVSADGGLVWSLPKGEQGVTVPQDDTGPLSEAAIQCSGLSDCLVLDGGGPGATSSIYRLTDMTRDWAQESTPSGVSLADLSCLTTGACIAVGQLGVASGQIHSVILAGTLPSN